MLVWKVNTPNPDVASVRIRCLKPLRLMHERGLSWELASGRANRTWHPDDTLINVKSYTFHDLYLVQAAHRAGAKVVLDLCDNLFVESYRSEKTIDPKHIFTAMCRYASLVVVPTTALEARVQQAVGNPPPVVVIEDGIDRASDARSYRKLLARRQRQPVAELQHRLVRDGRRSVFRRLPELILTTLRDARRRRTESAAAAVEPVPAESDNAVALWFGNHGAKHSDFGMRDLRLAKAALERLATEMPIELWVVSNDEAKYEHLIDPIAIPSRYFAWNAGSIEQFIARADVVLVPNNLNEFSRCKSANRSVLSLSIGTPVVASATPAHEPLHDCIMIDDWYKGIKRYLSDPATRKAHLEAAQTILDERYSDRIIAQSWRRELEKLEPRGFAAVTGKIGFLLTLVQDLEVLSPLIERIRPSAPIAIFLDEKLAEAHPHVFLALRKYHPSLVHYQEFSAFATEMKNLKALVTAAESNLNPHKLAHRFTNMANQHGVATFTVQHGFENIGLTYSDEAQPADRIRFASNSVLTWVEPSQLHPDCPEETVAKCIPIGCPKSTIRVPAALTLPGDYRSWIGIFENLHWTRYTDSYREDFIAAVTAVCESFPDIGFVLRPHQAGRWLTHRYKGPKPESENLVILDPANQESRSITARSLLAGTRAVITSPSTVAIDAALVGLPTAIVAGDLENLPYEPLAQLRSSADWIAFVAEVLADTQPSDHVQRARNFVQEKFGARDALASFETIISNIA